MNLTYPMRFGSWFQLLPGLSLDFSTSQREVWLTFDDGPAGAMTEWTLEELAKRDIPATFFVVTAKVIGQRPLVKKIREAGNEVALHGWFHRSQLWRNPTQTLEEWRDSRDRIQQIVGESVSRFRPPYTNPPLRCWRALLHEAFRPVYLTWMLGDFIPTLAVQPVIDAVVPQVSGGDILLLHDGGPAPTVYLQMLPNLLDRMMDAGWKFVIPSDSQLRNLP